jgi:hypothetical protein
MKKPSGNPWFRLIPRFHLDELEAGRCISVYKIDPESGEQLRMLASARVGEDGWVGIPEPITVWAGGAFVAVLGPQLGDGT